VDVEAVRVQVHHNSSSRHHPRDSGIFLKGEGEEGSEADQAELILSPINLQKSTPGKVSGVSSSISSSEASSGDPYADVRSRFLQHKSFFEATTAAAASNNTNAIINGCVGGGGGIVPGIVQQKTSSSSSHHHSHQHQQASPGESQQHNNNATGRTGSGSSSSFLYCEKSSDSGISVCTNSPPPLRNEYRT
jgi:hypothetical protein